MSRLNDLIRQVANSDEALADDLKQEFKTLVDRRSFGLNFERHVPETVELPGRQVRRGDKVRILPPRGETPKKADQKLWRVTRVGSDGQAELSPLDAESDEVRTASVDDLVVVAEFRDPIYPGLASTGTVERGGDKPFHSVIDAENYHALQALLFAYRGRVDAIYIDPPYNTRDKDWKYNNDYVDKDDAYRHSKWLAFMERRLVLSKDLLDPDDSVLIVTIDEKEFARLRLLLEQIFPEARIQVVSTLINPAAASRTNEFGRSDEFYFFVMFGASGPKPLPLGEGWVTTKGRTHRGQIRWDLLRRSGTNVQRERSPGTFYPFYVNQDGSGIHSIGEALPLYESPATVSAPEGTVAVWPIRRNGTQGVWQMTPENSRQVWQEGFMKTGQYRGEQTTIYYLKPGERSKIDEGLYEITGTADDGSVLVGPAIGGDTRKLVPGTQWRVPGHDSSQYGSRLLGNLMPDRKFPFPKSLYAVEDALRFFVGHKKDAVVLDFFAGSGTTTHAVMRLNKQDDGRRQSISVTNNEVSAEEESKLRSQGLRPGDPEWDALGICEFFTNTRIRAAMTGTTPDGSAISGEYKFTDEFPMSEGFEENVEFFKLTYEAPLRVANHRDFGRIAPLLWLRAGSMGRRIDDVSDGWDVANAYGVLANLDFVEPFLEAIRNSPDANVAFIVTDEDRLFETISGDLPEHVEPVRLYESYLRNFEIAAGRGAR